MTLSKAQSELLEAMRKGVVVHCIGGMNPYYFRSDTMRACAKTVSALEKRGLLEQFYKGWRGLKLRVKP